MSGGFFSKLLGGNKKQRSSEPAATAKSPWGKKQSWLEPCFKLLEHHKAGLAKRAARYVETGEDRIVLADIGSAVSSKQQQPYNHSLIHDGISLQRLAMIKMFRQPEMIARMAEVIDASEPSATAFYSLSKNIKLDMPGPVMALIRRLMAYSRTPMKEDPGYGESEAEDFIKAVEILGGRAADILLVDLGQRYGQRIFLTGNRALGDVLLETAPADEIIHAFKAMDGGTRANALQKFSRSKRAKDAELVAFLMDELNGGSAKSREQARQILLKHDPALIEPLVTEGLSGGKASLRAEAAIILGELGTETGRAALEARKGKEKTASVLAVIDQYVAGAQQQAAADVPEFDGLGYIAADGSTVEFAPHTPLTDDGSAPLGAEDKAALVAARKKYDEELLASYERHLEWRKQHGRAGSYKRDKPAPLHPRNDKLFDWANAPIERRFGIGEEYSHHAVSLTHGYGAKWLDQRMDKFPLLRQLRIALLASYNVGAVFSPYRMGAAADAVVAAVEDGLLDMRHIIDEANIVGLRVRRGRAQDNKADVITAQNFIETQLSNRHDPNIPAKAIQPIVARTLDQIIAALPPRTTELWVNRRALKLLEALPKLPAAAVQPVLFCAISERAALREAAQPLLADVDGIDDRLIDVLQDSRQAVRGSAARFIADRGITSAVKPLTARLKKEKSESARAEMISALSRLGADTSAYLGQAAILKEATALAAKLPGVKIDWLPVAQAPVLKWSDGKTVDPIVPEAWLKLALKLKEPAGSPLFSLYFDQLDPDTVTAFCDWVLASWIAYDSDMGDQAALRAKAQARATADLKAYGHHAYYANKTVDELTDQYMSYMQGTYPNSGTDSKGILALTHRAAPSTQSAKIQAYLKAHGKRVSQAKCLVEVLAATGTPEALQVLVATATRFKQRTVRELAEKLVAEIASERGWTEDELADRSVPSGGFQEDGTLILPTGEEHKLYVARLGEDLTVKLFNPEGKPVKALPAGKDANTKESKSLLSAAKKTVKTVTAQQADRLYGAMVAGRRWPLPDWTADIRSHPILSRLSERVIWLGYDAGGALVATFRPTPEGDLLTADGEDADLSAVKEVAIAHTSHLEEDTRAEWVAHLDDFEVKPLFAQVSRPMQVLSDAQKQQDKLTDREGWLMESLRLRSATTKAGFDRGAVEDGAGFNTYVKPFKSAGLTVVLEFTGSYVPEDNIPTAIISMYFVRGTNSYGRKLKLGDVPPILLSECWSDLYQIAESGAFDPEWRKKGLY